MEENVIINMTGKEIKIMGVGGEEFATIPPHKNVFGLPIVIDVTNYSPTSVDIVRTEFGDIVTDFGWPYQKFQVYEVSRSLKTRIDVIYDNMGFHECRKWIAHEVDIAREKTGNKDVELTIVVDPRVYLSGFNKTGLNYPPNTKIVIAVGRKTITRKDWLGQTVSEEIFTHLAYPAVII